MSKGEITKHKSETHDAAVDKFECGYAYFPLLEGVFD